MQDEFLSSTIFFYCCEIFFSKSNSSLEKHELCNLMSGTSNRSSHFLQFINLFVIKIQEKKPTFLIFLFFHAHFHHYLCVLYSSSELFTHLLNQFSYLSYVLYTQKEREKLSRCLCLPLFIQKLIFKPCLIE